MPLTYKIRKASIQAYRKNLLYLPNRLKSLPVVIIFVK